MEATTSQPGRPLRRICVYCGSSKGNDEAYETAAIELAQAFAARGIGLVYGAGSVGLMGILADAALAAGVDVIGIIPHHLIAMEVSHPSLSSLIAVDTMHARKFQMAEMSDAFIALPGGIGTAEELLEVLTWLQLGIHSKPIGILNTKGYFRHFLQFLGHMEECSFLRREHRELLIVEDDITRLLAKLESFVPKAVSKVPGR